MYIAYIYNKIVKIAIDLFRRRDDKKVFLYSQFHIYIEL